MLSCHGSGKRGYEMTAKKCIRNLVWLLVLLMAVPPGVFAQAAPPPPPAGGQQAAAQAPIFSQEELDQMLAPIALYPDQLLIQVLMGSTYPMEIVAADRWLNANKNLGGDQLAAALEQQSWDPSVKSLVNFPSVLGMMDQKLEWTQKVGDAFLSQEEQVMATVQKLRAAAQSRGNLVSNNQQRVVTQGTTIVIEPVNPQVVYVPAYNPVVVYGPWWYPSYPPYAYVPVGAVIAGAAISFGVGIAVGAAWGYAWGGFDWGHRHATFNVYQNTYVHNSYINRSAYAGRYGGGGRGTWHHDPGHRGGVAYRDHGLNQRYGGANRGPGGHGPGGIHGGGPGGHGTGGIHGSTGPKGGTGSNHPGLHGGTGTGGKTGGTLGSAGHGPKGLGGAGGHQGISGSKSGTAGPKTVSRNPGGLGGGGGHSGGSSLAGGNKGALSTGGPKGGALGGAGGHSGGAGGGAVRSMGGGGGHAPAGGGAAGHAAGGHAPHK
jgi:hypothetical protein